MLNYKSVQGEQKISQPDGWTPEYNLWEDSVALAAIIAIIIAAIASLAILGFPKRKYFRCKTCNEGSWRVNEEDSEGKKIMEIHKEMYEGKSR